MKIKFISPMAGVRCMLWMICARKNCDHYPPHSAQCPCVIPHQVRYCTVMECFVTDTPLADFDSTLSNDPNLSFKSHKEYRH